MSKVARLQEMLERPLVGSSGIREAVAGSGCKVVSFDLFDTLIYRTVAQPRHAFLLQGQALIDRGYFNGTAHQWLRARTKAEAEIAERIRPREVRLQEIYDSLLQNGTLADAEAAAHAVEAEFAAEAMVIRAHPEAPALINALRSAGMHVIVVSDTYMPLSFIGPMLQKLGIIVDEVICSSETGKTKRFGDTFRVLRGDFPEIVHFGDNFAVDVFSARRARVSSRWLTWPIYGHRNRYKSEITYLNDIGLYQIPPALESVSDDPLRELAKRWAIVLYDYLREMRDYARSQQITDIWLLSRDGESLAAVLSVRPDFLKGVRLSYVRASRKFTHSITALRAPERFKTWMGRQPRLDEVDLGKLATRYYRDRLHPETKRVLMVDMTGKGRLQASIRDAIPEDVPVAGFYFSLDVDSEPNADAAQFLPHSYAGFHQAPVEALSGFTEGSCISAREVDGTVEPMLEDDPADIAPSAYVEELRKTLAELCDLDWTVVDGEQSRTHVVRSAYVRRLLMYPPRWMARAMDSWSFIDKHGAEPSFLTRPAISLSSRILARKSAENGWPSLAIHAAAPAWAVGLLQRLSQVRLSAKDRWKRLSSPRR